MKSGTRKFVKRSSPRRYSSDEDQSDYSDDYSDEDDYSDSDNYNHPSPRNNKMNNKSPGRYNGRDKKSNQDSPRSNGNTKRSPQTKQSSSRKSTRVSPYKTLRDSSIADMMEKPFAKCWWFKIVGLKSFFDTHDDIHPGEYDTAMSAMALMCTLMLLVPFGIMVSIGHGYLDDITIMAQRCHGELGVTYDRIYMGYRIIILFAIYSALCGMVLSLFYFLFRRSHLGEYRLWHPKARALAILVFFFTSICICSIVTLANWLFDYYLLPSSANICNNSTALFIFPGLVITGATFLVGFCLVL